MAWAEEGRRHNIPLCCGIRFGIDCERPKLLVRFLPRLARRLKTFTPRMAMATWDGQGWVPCEYHLVWWVLTGKTPDILQDDPDGPDDTSRYPR